MSRRRIVPAFVGGLLAYICRPLVTRLERYWIPRGLAVGLLLLTFGTIAVVSVNRFIALIPIATGMLDRTQFNTIIQTSSYEERVKKLKAKHDESA